MNISRVSFGTLFINVPYYSIPEFEKVRKILEEKGVPIIKDKSPRINIDEFYIIDSTDEKEASIKNTLRKHGMKVTDTGEEPITDVLTPEKAGIIIKELNESI